MTRVSKNKKELILSKYNEYIDLVHKYKESGNTHMYEIYINKLKAIRMILSLLEIHVYGINQSSPEGRGMKIKFTI